MKPSYPNMSNEEFKDRIKAICGPAPKADRPCVRKPTDRGYHPPPTAVWVENSTMCVLYGPPKEAV